jgi:hypothetical protein
MLGVLRLVSGLLGVGTCGLMLTAFTVWLGVAVGAFRCSAFWGIGRWVGIVGIRAVLVGGILPPFPQYPVLSWCW